MRFALPLALFLPLYAFAQNPTDVFEKAPPEVESALRARVAKFFQAHVDAKFRQAEQVIHEDSLDAFYNSEKQKLVGFEISRIKYSENFTKAEVITDVELDWVTARTGKIRVKPPMKSTWKLDKGLWWWYVIPRTEWDTPFGLMKSGDQQSSPSAPIKIPDAQTILGQLTADKSTVTLDSAKISKDSAQIRSDMPGSVSLAVEPYTVEGLRVRVSKTALRKGESATVTFDYTPPDATAKTPRIVYVRASPAAKTFSFTITFNPPEKPATPQLPKPGAAQ